MLIMRRKHFSLLVMVGLYEHYCVGLLIFPVVIVGILVKVIQQLIVYSIMAWENLIIIF